MRIRSQFAIQLAGGAANVILLTGLVPVLIRTLGLERYGVLLLVLGLTIYAVVADFGLGLATSQKMPRARVGERAQVLGTALVFGTLFGAAAGAAFACLSISAFGSLIGLSADAASELKSAWPAIFLLGLGTVVTGIPQGALLGMSRFVAWNVVNVVGTAMGVLAPASYALLVGHDLGGLILAVALGRALTLTLALWCCWRAGVAPRLRPAVPGLAQELLGFGGWSALANMLQRLTYSIDRPLIGIIAGAAAVPSYAVPQSMLLRINIVPGALTSAAFPRLARAGTSAESDRIVAACYRSVLLLTPAFVLAVFLMPTLIRLWLGADFATAASAPAILLTVSIWIDMIAGVPFVLMQTTARLHRETLIGSAVALPNAALLVGALIFSGVAGAAAVAIARSAAYLGGRLFATGWKGLPAPDLLIQAGLVGIAALAALGRLDASLTVAAGSTITVASTTVALLRRPSFVDEAFSWVIAVGRPTWQR